MKVFVAASILAASAVATHTALLRWLGEQGVVEALLSTGTDAPPVGLLAASTFLVLRVGVILVLPGLVAGSGIWVVTGLVARGRQGR